MFTLLDSLLHDATCASESGMIDTTPDIAAHVSEPQELVDVAYLVVAADAKAPEHDHIVEAPPLSRVTEQFEEASDVTGLSTNQPAAASADVALVAQAQVQATDCIAVETKVQATDAIHSTAIATVDVTVSPDDARSVDHSEDALAAELESMPSMVADAGQLQATDGFVVDTELQATDEIVVDTEEQTTDVIRSTAIATVDVTVPQDDARSADHSEDTLTAEPDSMPSMAADAEIEPADAREGNDVATEESVTVLSSASLGGADDHGGPDAWWAQDAFALGLASGGLSSAQAAHEAPMVESVGDTKEPEAESMGLSPPSPADSVEKTAQWDTRQALGANVSVMKHISHAPFSPLMPLPQHAAGSHSIQRQSARASLGTKASVWRNATEIALSPEPSLQLLVPTSQSKPEKYTRPAAIAGSSPMQNTAAVSATAPDLVEADHMRRARGVRSAFSSL